MTTLSELAAAVASLAELELLPPELAAGTPFQAPLSEHTTLSISFNPHAQHWVIALESSTAQLTPDALSAVQEALIRHSCEHRYSDGRVGAMEHSDRLSLAQVVDTLPAQPAELEALFESLHNELEQLLKGAAPVDAVSDMSDHLPSQWMRV